jgi:hypothetical protein
MTDLEASENNSWHRMHTFLWRKLTILQIFANLAGAGIVTSYFMFFESGTDTAAEHRWPLGDTKPGRRHVRQRQNLRNYPTKIKCECPGNPGHHRADLREFPAKPGAGR